MGTGGTCPREQGPPPSTSELCGKAPPPPVCREQNHSFQWDSALTFPHRQHGRGGTDLKMSHRHISNQRKASCSGGLVRKASHRAERELCSLCSPAPQVCTAWRGATSTLLFQCAGNFRSETPSRVAGAPERRLTLQPSSFRPLKIILKNFKCIEKHGDEPIPMYLPPR